MACAPPPATADSLPYVGQVIDVAGWYCPNGFFPTDGRLLDIASHDTLFTLLGTTYGGNGTTNFAIPTLRPAVTASGATRRYCIADFGIFPPQN